MAVAIWPNFWAQQVAPTRNPKAVRQGQVFGVDFSTAQLEVAAQRVRDRVPPLPITWLEGDALSLPFPEAHFDAATMGYGLRNVTDIPQSLKELHRVLKPTAKAAILDFNHPTNPLVQQFQQWYLGAIVVPTAERFGMTDEYAYIGPSLDRFPTRKKQIEMARQAGFSAATHYPICGRYDGSVGCSALSFGPGREFHLQPNSKSIPHPL